MLLAPTLLLLTLAVLLCLSALFSGIETAAVSVNDFRLRHDADQGNAASQRTVAMLRDRQRILAVTLVGNNLVNVMIALLAEHLLEVSFAESTAISIPLINFLIVTPVLLVCGEIVPKQVFRVWSDRLIVRFTGFIQGAGMLFVPVVSFCTLVAGLMARPFGVRLDKTAFRRKVSPEDIRAILSEGEKQGEIAKGELLMIDRIFDLQETMVREIMKPLVDVVALYLPETTIEGIKARARETGFSRFPVYSNEVVNLEGYIDIYEILTKAKPEDKPAKFVRKGHVVPETARVDALLPELLRHRQPAAIVIDEHGGSVGWVTLEDVLEEIVGEIEDEFDSREIPGIQRLDEHTLVVPAAIDIDDLNRQTKLELAEDEDFDTLGGLIYTRLERVPQVGDTVIERGYELRVLEMSGHKITLVRVERIAPPPLDHADDERRDETSAEDLAGADDQAVGGLDDERRGGFLHED